MHTMTIDAEGKTLGRVASAAAKALLGKHTPTFTKHLVAEIEVTILNANKIKVTGAKEGDKTYVRYSGYPGGQKKEKYSSLITRRGHREVIRRAVLGMLPKNRLQARRIKLLTIKD